MTKTKTTTRTTTKTKTREPADAAGDQCLAELRPLSDKHLIPKTKQGDSSTRQFHDSFQNDFKARQDKTRQDRT